MKRLRIIGYLLLLVIGASTSVLAYSEEEMETLRMFYGDKDLITTSTRSEKEVSQVAENVTVITADDISGMNAHTVQDVLYWIPGLQIPLRSPGVPASEIKVQGSKFSHVRVLIDGVTLNNYSDNFADLAVIPVQIVERIEIILGPASSVWGSALGGVINIITKTPAEPRLGGEASVAGGERGTADVRGEVSGSVSQAGYYLSGNELRSDGLRPTNQVQRAGTYGKLTWKDGVSVSQLTAGHFHGSRDFETLPGDLDLTAPDHKTFFSTVSHRRTIGENFSVEASFRTLEQEDIVHVRGPLVFKTDGHELTLGGSLLASWRDGWNNITGGVDFDYAHTDLLRFTSFTGTWSTPSGLEPYLRKWGYFGSDTITAGPFSFTPGIRYDYVNTQRGLFSPSLGVTWGATPTTVCRAYAGRGFSLPIAKQNVRSEKVFSLQAGVEQGVPGYLWVKGTLFRNDISDFITDSFVNDGKKRRQGVQVELRTAPVFDTSFSAGYVFIDSTDRETGKIVPGSPRYTVDLGLRYATEKLHASVMGHYIWYVPNPPDGPAPGDTRPDYHRFVWDLNLSRKLPMGNLDGEVFFTGHNLLDANQYVDDFNRNPGRWLEGGLRVKF
jgi:vitamin B12 transporter